MRAHLIALILVLVSCAAVQASERSSAAPVGAGSNGTVSSKVDSLSLALGANRVYLMAGDDLLRAGLGQIDMDSDDLRPVILNPDPALVSNVSGNGAQVVMGAAGLASASGAEGVLADGVYLLRGSSLVRRAGPGSGMLGPVIGPDGSLAAASAVSGFAVRRPSAKTWRRDARLRGERLTALAWTPRGDLVTVLDAQKSSARFVLLSSEGGQKIIGRAFCASLVLASPDGRSVATVPSYNSRVRATTPGCRTGQVVALSARRRIPVPKGWRPLAWSKDSESLLVSRAHELAVWELGGGFRARIDVGVSTWMAAPIYFAAE